MFEQNPKHFPRHFLRAKFVTAILYHTNSRVPRTRRSWPLKAASAIFAAQNIDGTVGTCKLRGTYMGKYMGKYHEIPLSIPSWKNTFKNWCYVLLPPTVRSGGKIQTSTATYHVLCRALAARTYAEEATTWSGLHVRQKLKATPLHHGYTARILKLSEAQKFQ